MNSEAPAVFGTPPARDIPTPATPRLDGFEAWAWRAFGRWAERPRSPDELEDRLLETHSRLRASEYLAVMYAALVLTAAAAGAAGAAVALLFVRSVGEAPGIALGVAVPVLATGSAYLYLATLPALQSRERGRRIDRQLGPAANFASAMSCANVRVDEIFRELAAQPLYGEVTEEARWIARDTDLLGMDILSALRRAVRRCPSPRFQEFLQGIVATSESGGELRPYFLKRSEQYEREGELAALEGLERMGLFAEAFVTLGVAFPLFVIVLLAALSMVATATAGLVDLLWATVLGILPVTLLAFGLVSRALAEGL